MSVKSSREADRLERLWAGTFGKAYILRNQNARQDKQEFWRRLLKGRKIETALEVGCNIGGNLYWLRNMLKPNHVSGVDINQEALAQVRTSMPDVNAVWASARELPFKNNLFDLTFTMGVLIHQPDESLLRVMSEVVRCSGRYVLCAEYHAPKKVEVPYRGQQGALFKRDYGTLYLKKFPSLKLESHFFMGPEHGKGWDDIDVWLFRKSNA